MSNNLHTNDNSELYTIVFNDVPTKKTVEIATEKHIFNKALWNGMLWIGGIIAVMIAISTLIN